MGCHHDAPVAFGFGVDVVSPGRPSRPVRGRPRRGCAAVARRRAGVRRRPARPRAPDPRAVRRRESHRRAHVVGRLASRAHPAGPGRRRIRARGLPPAAHAAAGGPMEAKFWEAEALLRVKRLGEARAAYDEVVRKDAASPLAPDALYGLAWTDLELRRPEAAAKEFRDLLTAWPNHPQAGSATYSLARALVELKRFDEAIPLLQRFPAKFSGNKLIPSSQYLLGWARVTAGQWKD